MICAALPFFPQVYPSRYAYTSVPKYTWPQRWKAGAQPNSATASFSGIRSPNPDLFGCWVRCGWQAVMFLIASLEKKSQVLHWSVQFERRNVLKIKHVLSSNGKYLSKNAVNCIKVLCKRTVIYHETTLLERTAVIRNKLHWPLLQGLKASFFGAVETHLPSSKGWIKMLCLT